MKKIISMLIFFMLVLSFCSTSYAAGIITATDPIDGSGGTVALIGIESGNKLFEATPKPGYKLDGWTVSDTGQFWKDNPLAVTERDTTITARFSKIEYTISVTASPKEGGIVSGGGVFHYGDSVTFSAEASRGYDFSGWSGISATPATQTQTVTSDLNVVANFTPQVHTLKATVDPAGSGYVNGVTAYDSGTITYEAGKVIGVKAQPVTGYVFEGWYESGSKISSTADEIFDIDRDRTLVAKFVKAGEVSPSAPESSQEIPPVRSDPVQVPAFLPSAPRCRRRDPHNPWATYKPPQCRVRLPFEALLRRDCC